MNSGHVSFLNLKIRRMFLQTFNPPLIEEQCETDSPGLILNL